MASCLMHSAACEGGYDGGRGVACCARELKQHLHRLTEDSILIELLGGEVEWAGVLTAPLQLLLQPVGRDVHQTLRLSHC